mmetsp:Transcript_97383/g.302783  ORF Transcript_97383/g.302783 Transcript_97383/m.302783 type:complete len:214 (+) Transcript_97383:346-987(+)
MQTDELHQGRPLRKPIHPGIVAAMQPPQRSFCLAGDTAEAQDPAQCSVVGAEREEVRGPELARGRILVDELLEAGMHSEVIPLVGIHSCEVHIGKHGVEDEWRATRLASALPELAEDAPPGCDERMATWCCEEPVLDVLALFVWPATESLVIEGRDPWASIAQADSQARPEPGIQGPEADRGHISIDSTKLLQQRQAQGIGVRVAGKCVPVLG